MTETARVNVRFNSAADLESFLKVNDAPVGPRTGPTKRTHDEKEIYALRQFLHTRLLHEGFTFPLVVMKSERPDFLITLPPAEIVGLEITEATTQAWQRDLTRFETDDSEDTLLIGNDGWVGDSPERETCAAILRAMRRKARKVRSGGYQQCARYDLLIYVNVRAFFYKAADVMALLRKVVAKYPRQWHGLGRVSVLTNLLLFHDVTGALQAWPLAAVQ